MTRLRYQKHSGVACRVFLMCLLFLNGVPALSQGLDLNVPSNRYIFKNREYFYPAYWSEGIVLDIVGEFSADLGFTGASYVRSASGYSETDFVLAGPPSDWFTSNEAVKNEANYVISFGPLKHPLGDAKDIIHVGQDFEMDLSNASREMRQLFESGLRFGSTGCYGVHGANDRNVIHSFATFIDSRLPADEKKNCIERVALGSFGVLPYFSEFSFPSPDMLGLNRDESFFDKSEGVFLLITSAFCRNALDDYSFDCPGLLLMDVYGKHRDLILQYSK